MVPKYPYHLTVRTREEELGLHNFRSLRPDQTPANAMRQQRDWLEERDRQRSEIFLQQNLIHENLAQHIEYMEAKDQESKRQNQLHWPTT